MAVTDWRFAGTGANDAAVGNAAWSNPGNIVASNDTRAVSGSMGAGQTTQILRATNFGFSTAHIPEGSTIDGIEVRIERQRNSSGGNQVQDNLVRLRLSAGQLGDNKAVTGNWPNNDGQATYGGAADGWAASLTDVQIRGSDFGVDIRAERGNGTAAVAGVDAVEIRIHYTEPAAAEFNLSGAVTGPIGIVSGSAIFTPPNNDRELSGVVTGFAGSVAGEATHVPPQFNLSGGVTGYAGSVSGEATHAPPQFNLSGGVIGFAGSVAGNVEFAKPAFNLSGGVQGPLGLVEGSISFAEPAADDRELSGSVTGFAGSVSGEATHVPPQFNLNGGVTGPLGQVQGLLVQADVAPVYPVIKGHALERSQISATGEAASVIKKNSYTLT